MRNINPFPFLLFRAMSSPFDIAKKINESEPDAVSLLTALRREDNEACFALVVKALRPPEIFFNEALWLELSTALRECGAIAQLAIIKMMDRVIPRVGQLLPEDESQFSLSLSCFSQIFNVLDNFEGASDPMEFQLKIIWLAMNHCSSLFFAQAMIPCAPAFIRHLKRIQAAKELSLYHKMIPVFSHLAAFEPIGPCFRELNVEDIVSLILMDTQAINRVFGKPQRQLRFTWCLVNVVFQVHC